MNDKEVIVRKTGNKGKIVVVIWSDWGETTKGYQRLPHIYCR